MLTPNIELNNKTILVTGAAGFIGANLAMSLLRDVPGVTVVGLDSVNDDYEIWNIIQVQKSLWSR